MSKGWLIALLLVAGCGERREIKVTSDPIVPIEAEEIPVPLFQVVDAVSNVKITDMKKKLSPEIAGAEKYSLKFEWIVPGEWHQFLLFHVVDGKIAEGVRMVNIANPDEGTPRYEAQEYVMPWGHLNDIEIRLHNDEAGDLIFERRNDEARAKSALVRTVRVNLTGKRK